MVPKLSGKPAAKSAGIAPIIIATFSAIALLQIPACSGSGGSSASASPPPPPPPPPPPSPPPPPPPAPTSDTYFIAPTGSDTGNDGSIALPWRSIQFGVDQMNAGDTLSVGAGVYEERVLIQGSGDSGQDGSPITIQADAGAIIDGAALTPSGQDALLALDDVSYVVVDGFEIRNFQTPTEFLATATPTGILITGDTQEIEINNNVIHSIENNSTCSQNDNCGVGANGIAVYGRTTAGIRNITFDGNEVYNNKTASSEAFVLNGNVNGFIVRDNYVHDNNNIGLDFIGFEGECSACTDATERARNGIVSSNRIENNSTGNLGGNPWYGTERSAGGIYVDGGSNIIIDRNLVSGNDLGIEIASEAPGKTTTDIIVSNNVIYDNDQVGLALGGYNANASQSGGGGVDRIYVHNNSFYKNRGWGTDLTLQYRVTNSQFYNNSIYADGNVSEGLSTNISGAENQPDLTWNNNLWWADGNNDGAPVDPSTSLVANPLYTAPATGDLQPQNASPLAEAGTLSADITGWNDPFWDEAYPPSGDIPAHGNADYASGSRIIGTVDIGAYED